MRRGSATRTRDPSRRGGGGTPGPDAAPPPAPKAEFDPRDRERTYRWIADEATAFRLEYLPAKKAVEDNSLNDDLLKEFTAKKLPSYKAKFQALVGREVAWRAKVHGVGEEGVTVEADEHFFLEPYTGSGQPLAFLYMNLFIENGHVNEEDFSERRRLRLGKQITRDFAKTLKFGEEITLTGRIGKVDFKFG